MSKSGDGAMVRLYEWLHIRLPQYVDCRPIHVQELIEAAGFEIRQAEIRKILGVPVEIVVAGRDHHNQYSSKRSVNFIAR